MNEDPNFWSNGRTQKKELMKEDHIFLLNGRVHINKINQQGPCIFVEWWCTNKRNKSVWTLIFGRMVVFKRKNK